jgi:hypothetical protein
VSPGLGLEAVDGAGEDELEHAHEGLVVHGTGALALALALAADDDLAARLAAKAGRQESAEVCAAGHQDALVRGDPPLAHHERNVSQPQ